MKTKGTFYLLLFLAIVLWIYNIIKSTQVPFYWDEIYTYLRYVKPGVIFIREYERMDANNHLLNTWLIQGCVKVFGVSEFIIRLPSVFSFTVYAFFALRFSSEFKSLLFQFGCLFVLLLNPFLNDYFCLARGYSISMAFMLGSLYYAFKFIENNFKYHHAFTSLLFASLSLLANFSMLNYLLILLMIYILFFYFNFEKYKKNISEILYFILSLIAPIAVLSLSVPIILNLKNVGALFAGGKKDSFWQDTLQSLIERFLYQPMEVFWPVLLIEIGLMLVLLLSLIQLVKTVKSKTADAILKFQSGLFVMLFLLVVINIFQHEFMGVLYGYGRTAMYFYPLLSLACIYTLSGLNNTYPVIAKSIFATIVIVFTVNFTLNANTKYAIDWQEEGDAKLMVNDLKKYNLDSGNRPADITVGMTFPYHDDLIFYKEIYQLNWLNYVQNEFAFNPLNDYFFIALKDTIYLKNIPFKILSKYKASQAALIQNRQAWTVNTVFNSSYDYNKEDELKSILSLHGENCMRIDSLNSFSKGITINVVDSFLKSPSKVFISGKIYGNEKNEDAKIVLSFERNGQAYLWQAWPANYFLNKKNTWIEFNISALCSTKMKSGDEIKCYVWNTSSTPVFVNKFACKLDLFFPAKPN